VKSINFNDLIGEVPDPWQPKDVAYVNNTALRIAKIQGTYHWHTHRNEDEFFYVLKGEICIDIQEASVTLKKHEGYLVKRGTRHRSRAEKPAWILLIEPIKTKTKGEES
jgi:mannose-6-phosphate isomerase-like protein (cupin superfamily)